MGFFDLSAYNIERGDEKSNTPVVHDCKACGRYKDCSTPKAPAIGNGLRGILVIGPEMTTLEDNSGNDKHGTHYRFLKRAFKQAGLDLEEDCWYTHAIRCHSKQKIGATTESACHQKLVEEIKRLKPRIIVTTCQQAFDVLLYERMAGRAATARYLDWCGETIPDQVLETWIMPIYPTDMMMKEEEERYNRYELYYGSHLRAIAGWDREFTRLDTETTIRSCRTDEDIQSALDEIASWSKFAFDYETTGIKPHRKGHEIAYISASNGKVSYSFKTNPKILKRWDSIMQNDAIKIAHNQSFERSWTEVIVGREPKRLIHDTMLAQHCLNNRKPTGLKFLTYARYGFLGYDSDCDEFLKSSREEQEKYGANGFNRVKEAPVTKMLKYNAMDSLFTYWLYEDLIDSLDVDHQLPGYRFFMVAQVALDRAHQNGMNVNVPLMDETREKLQADIRKYEHLIMDDPLIRTKWDKQEFNPKSDNDVRHLLFDILGYEVYSRTETGLAAVDAEALLAYKDRCELAKNILGYRRWGKALNTYIGQASQELVGENIHPFFNLHRVATYRSSSNAINFQNQPKRDKEVMRVLRSMYTPSRGHRIIEYDFKGAEVSASAAISGDANLIKYVSDPSLDMHRDLAARMFMLPIEQINKAIRGELVKGPWTFAQFYGSWYKQCAENIWQMLQAPNATYKYGMDLLAHLAYNGIVDYQDWEEHCKKQEEILWGPEFFEGYQSFRDSTFDSFKEKGYIDFVNGFRYYGPATRNECLNAPVQGPAFHIQLWAFTRITRIMQERGMNSRLIGQVHDSMLIDCDPAEELYVDHLVYEYATQRVRGFWEWVTVPLMIEKERSAIDGNWANMEACGYLKEVRIEE